MNDTTSVKLDSKMWLAHDRHASRVISAICRKKVKCVSCNDDSLAYTHGGKYPTIYTNKTHPIVPKDAPSAVKFDDGLKCHEMGHQMFTDFIASENFAKILKTGSNIPLSQWLDDAGLEEKLLEDKYSDKELELFLDVNNIIEDTAIEYWCYHTLDGYYPEALRYTVLYTYKLGPRLEEIKEPFSQVCSAMLQYGDIGLLKGRFTFPEAREMFLKIQPMYDQAIEEPNCRKRITISYLIFEELRPLWEPKVKSDEAFEEMLKELAKLLENMAGSGEGSGKGKYSTDATKAGSRDESSDKGDKDRKMKTVKMTRKEFEELKKAASSGGGEGEAVKVEIVDEDGDGSEKEEGSSDGKGSDSDDKSSDASDEGKAKSEGNSENTKDEEDKGPLPEDPESGILKEIDEDSIDFDKEFEEVWEEAVIDEKEYAEINARLEKQVLEENKLEKAPDENNVPNFNDIKGRGFTKASCKNVVEEGDSLLQSSYDNLVEQMNSDITRLSGQLKRATEKPHTVKTRRANGVLNIERYSKINVSQTTKLFDKRRLPNLNDLAVFVNVDESGSMSGRRITQAQATCVAIAEACARVQIPLYIMGFSADIASYDAYHLHYIRWKNSLPERWSLMKMRARANNFDGYSIRYGSRILMKRPEKSKLLIVISDGQPAANAYSDYSTVGVADTKDAVRQATADGIVVHGISIGGRSAEILKDIYGTHFTDNNDLSLLFRDFGNAILKQLKKE